MRALFGVMIIMGTQYLPQDQLYWDKDEFIGNSGIRKTFTVNRFHKLMEYLHISDRVTEAQRGDPNYDKLAKIQPMLKIVQQTFQDYYKPGKEQTIDEGMIAYKGKLSFMQYMLAKPIKHGIKVWMRCAWKSTYQHQFNIYLECRLNSEHGLGYDVVMQQNLNSYKVKTTMHTLTTCSHQFHCWMNCCNTKYMPVEQFDKINGIYLTL